MGEDLQTRMTPKSAKNCGKQEQTFIHAYIQITNVSEQTVTECTVHLTVFVKNFRTELHESLTDDPVADTGSQTDKQTNRCTSVTHKEQRRHTFHNQQQDIY